MERIEVIWADAHAGDNDTWVPIEDLHGEGEEYLVVSVGWLIVGAKAKHVTIAQSRTPDEQVDHVLHIPEGMIRKMTVLHALNTELS